MCEIMSSKKRNRDKIKSGSVSPKKNKRLNMAAKTPGPVFIKLAETKFCLKS